MRTPTFRVIGVLAVSIVALTAPGCSDSAGPTGPTVREPSPSAAIQVQMAPGERVTVPGTSLTLTFEQIYHPLHPGLVDCVAGVPCGPIGERALFQVRTPTDPGYHTYLYLTQPANRDRLTFDGYGIRLVRFVPDYDPDARLPESAYSVVFAVTP
jgi:hypothetical protein